MIIKYYSSQLSEFLSFYKNINRRPAPIDIISVLPYSPFDPANAPATLFGLDCADTLSVVISLDDPPLNCLFVIVIGSLSYSFP